ncbi:MAG: VOC family protein [Pseudomonadota bacterium]
MMNNNVPSKDSAAVRRIAGRQPRRRAFFLALAASLASGLMTASAAGGGEASLVRETHNDQAAQAPAMAFDHMSINVADFEAALDWYQEKLGFKLDVAWRVAALDGKQLAYLSLGDTVIELVAADAGGIGLPAPTDFADHFGRTGYGHLCFSVDSVDAVLAELQARGVPTFVRAETYALDGTPYERRVGFIKDPEGNVIEFAEKLRLR